MVSTLVSSLVLAWAIAPQITMSLQAVADDVAVETAPSEAAEILEEVVRPQLETPVAEDVVEDIAEEAAPPVTEPESTEPTQLDPIDTSDLFESGQAIIGLPRHEWIIANAREGCVGFREDPVQGHRRSELASSFGSKHSRTDGEPASPANGTFQFPRRSAEPVQYGGPGSWVQIQRIQHP